MVVLFTWWLLLEFLGVLALPLTLVLFRHLPDRGWPFARLLGSFLPAFLAWNLGMWQLASFGTGLVALCLLPLAVSWFFLRDRGSWEWIRREWRLIVMYEFLFAAALLAGALLRIYGAWDGVSLNHTEQPMDLALLNGILQSRQLPPQDPWLSGYGINYYYMGYFVAACLTLLAHLPSSVTFNLNLAGLFALTATGCFSLGYNLTRCSGQATRRRAAVIGACAALFVLLIGNQAGALQWITGSNQVVALDARELATVLLARLQGREGPVALGHTVYTSGSFGDRFDAVFSTAGRQRHDFDWWWPSRVVWDERPSATAVDRLTRQGLVGPALWNWRRYVSPEEIERSYAITEFPFFSFFLGDMHPHVMSLPLMLGMMALCLNILVAPDTEVRARGGGTQRLQFLVVAAVLMGGLYVTNSWDYPTGLLLLGAAWLWRWHRQPSNASHGWRRAAGELALLVGLSLLSYAPFHLTFRPLVGSREVPKDILSLPVLGRILSLPIVSRIFQTIGPVLWDKTSLHSLLLLFGVFLWPALFWLGGRWADTLRQDPHCWVALGATAAVSLALALVLHFPLLAIVPFLYMAWSLLGRARPEEAFALLILLVSGLLLLACDLIYLRDIFESRMNTIFKFYYQVWVMLGIAAAFALGQMGRRFLRHPAAIAAWSAPFLLLLAGALVYPICTLRGQLARGNRPWSLDGLAFMRDNYPGDYAGVMWLNENAAPDAVVLEAVGPEWGYFGRVSAATGRPTLIGWDGHEYQWRGGQPQALQEIPVRLDAARRILETTNIEEARQLLRAYSVSYVFLGSLERNLSPPARDKFAQLGTLVFEAPGVQIYRVLHDSDPGRSGDALEKLPPANGRGRAGALPPAPVHEAL
ncbi:MAG: DUF2298 domain-containing protein [Chloroflexia bacterium]